MSRDFAEKYNYKVTPFAGVWIEIKDFSVSDSTNKSLPSRECGLKSEGRDVVLPLEKSLPSRECGLKCTRVADRCLLEKSLPSRECGLKFFMQTNYYLPYWSLPSRECGLKWNRQVHNKRKRRSHSLRGSVD